MVVATAERIITSPLRLAGGPRLGELTTLITADVLARHARRQGRDASLVISSLPTDGATQAAVDRELAREGHDRQSLTRDEFVERVRMSEEDGRERVVADLAALGVAGDHETEPGGEQLVEAARTAFVTLFESGSIRRQRHVVNTCPRCATVVGAADSDVVEVEAERLTIRLWFSDAYGHVDLTTLTPELIPGTVALAMPHGTDVPGLKVELPLVGEDVPVLFEPGLEEPALVVPAHDRWGLELARRHRLGSIEVLDAEGVVRIPGTLDGLARYAARTAARDLLAAEGALVDTAGGTEVADRCQWCGTILVPRLGRHWFLPFRDLEVAAADALRHGSFTVAPPAGVEELMAIAGTATDWCLSEQVWAGQPLPISRCSECEQLDVSIERPTSCGRCMGVLDPSTDVLDPRFVAAVAPLVAAGYPEASPEALAAAAQSTTLVVGPDEIGAWALPMAALGLRLAGVVPFRRVVLACRAERLAVADGPELDPRSAVDVIGLVAGRGAAASRLALLAGDPEGPAADQLVQLLGRPPSGSYPIEVLASELRDALEAGSPATAVSVLTAALAEGLTADGRQLTDIVAPFVDAG